MKINKIIYLLGLLNFSIFSMENKINEKSPLIVNKNNLNSDYITIDTNTIKPDLTTLPHDVGTEILDYLDINDPAFLYLSRFFPLSKKQATEIIEIIDNKLINKSKTLVEYFNKIKNLNTFKTAKSNKSREIFKETYNERLRKFKENIDIFENIKTVNDYIGATIYLHNVYFRQVFPNLPNNINIFQDIFILDKDITPENLNKNNIDFYFDQEINTYLNTLANSKSIDKLKKIYLEIKKILLLTKALRIKLLSNKKILHSILFFIPSLSFILGSISNIINPEKWNQDPIFSRTIDNAMMITGGSILSFILPLYYFYLIHDENSSINFYLSNNTWFNTENNKIKLLALKYIKSLEWVLFHLGKAINNLKNENG